MDGGGERTKLGMPMGKKARGTEMTKCGQRGKERERYGVLGELWELGREISDRSPRRAEASCLWPGTASRIVGILVDHLHGNRQTLRAAAIVACWTAPFIPNLWPQIWGLLGWEGRMCWHPHERMRRPTLCYHCCADGSPSSPYLSSSHIPIA